MKDLAGKLLEMDNTARKMVDDASAYRDNLRESFPLEKERILKEFNEHAEMHIQAVRDTESAAAEEESTAMEQNYRELGELLESLYEERHADWEEELFRRCITEETA